MINLKAEGDRLYCAHYADNKDRAHRTEQEFASDLRDVLVESSVHDCIREARRQFMLRALYNATEMEDLKPILEKIINGD